MTDNTNLSIFHNGCLREILRIAMIKKTNKLGVTWSNWIQQCANHSKLREDFGYRVRRIETCQWNDPSHNSEKPQKEHKTHGPHHSTEALHFPQVQLKSLLPYNPRKPGIMVWTDMNLYHMKMLVSKSKKLYHLVLEKISNEFSYITISNLRSLCGHCCKQIWSYTTWGCLHIDLINATLVVLEKVGGFCFTSSQDFFTAIKLSPAEGEVPQIMPRCSVLRVIAGRVFEQSLLLSWYRTCFFMVISEKSVIFTSKR